MPELPEVHTTATMLHSLVKGLRIEHVWTDYKSPSAIGKDNIKDSAFFTAFKNRTVGATISRVHRIGKNVIFTLSNGETIIIHMKMTGHILYGTYTYNSKKKIWVAEKEKQEALHDPFNQYIHFVITLSDGKHLALSDVRKFAKVTIVPTDSLSTTPHLNPLGPEPLLESFKEKDFINAVSKKPNFPIKRALMDPSVIAGIGNIYSDEILFASGVHPLRPVKKVTAKEWKLLFTYMKLILKKGIDFGGDSTSDYRNPLGLHGKFHYHHKAYRNTGKPCEKPACKGVIKRIAFFGRGAHFCDTHQK